MNQEEHINTTPIDGIEILLNLARSGKIEPWDIDIGQVTDQYLQILSELKSQDLKLTGKTLLYAAILLRMKSDSLAGIDFLSLEPAEEFLEDDFVENKLGFLNKAFRSLDQLIQRRTSVKQPRNRRVTLNDLIKELKKYEDLERKRRLKETVEKHERRRMRNYADLSSDEIVELAHEEFIEDTVFRMKHILERFFLNDETVSLSQLETEGQIDRVSAFIAVLFLTAREECDLEQEEFYGELFITPMHVDALIQPLHPPLEMAG
jgi:segregation and condensation protein A